PSTESGSSALLPPFQNRGPLCPQPACPSTSHLSLTDSRLQSIRSEWQGHPHLRLEVGDLLGSLDRCCTPGRSSPNLAGAQHQASITCHSPAEAESTFCGVVTLLLRSCRSGPQAGAHQI